MNRHLETLMQKEMTRKEFLATMGLAMASVLGLSTVLRLLGVGKNQHSQMSGYGSRGYGR